MFYVHNGLDQVVYNFYIKKIRRSEYHVSVWNSDVKVVAVSLSNEREKELHFLDCIFKVGIKSIDIDIEKDFATWFSLFNTHFPNELEFPYFFKFYNISS